MQRKGLDRVPGAQQFCGAPRGLGSSQQQASSKGCNTPAILAASDTLAPQSPSGSTTALRGRRFRRVATFQGYNPNLDADSELVP